MSSQPQLLTGQSNQSLYFPLSVTPSLLELSITQHRPSSPHRDSHPISIPLEKRNIENITVQSIKKFFSENNEALQERSAIARRRVIAIKVLMASLIVLGATAIGGYIATSVVVLERLQASNGMVVLASLLGGFPASIVIYATILISFILIYKAKRELQLSRISQEFEKINPEKFVEFVAAELSEFQDIQQKIQDSAETNPQKFLEILYQICQIFTKWEKIEQNKQTIIDYDTLNKDILPKATELNSEVQQDLQYVVRERTGKKQGDIGSLREQISEEKEILKKLIS